MNIKVSLNYAVISKSVYQHTFKWVKHYDMLMIDNGKFTTKKTISYSKIQMNLQYKYY